jgi:dihydroxyacetone kinase
MKKLINKPEDVVKESLAGMALAHADLITVDQETRLSCVKVRQCRAR